MPTLLGKPVSRACINHPSTFPVYGDWFQQGHGPGMVVAPTAPAFCNWDLNSIVSQCTCLGILVVSGMK